MHELAITENIIKIACEEAVKHDVKKVLEIRIEVGELTGLIPSCIQEYFDIASKGTVTEGAKLIISKVPVTVRCKGCGSVEEFYPRFNYSCKNCGNGDFKIIKGNEFLIQSMEVD